MGRYPVWAVENYDKYGPGWEVRLYMPNPDKPGAYTAITVAQHVDTEERGKEIAETDSQQRWSEGMKAESLAREVVDQLLS